MRIALERHELFDAFSAEAHDAADVVACQIDEHDVFRALLGVFGELRGQSLVVLGRAPAPTGACDRSADHATVEDLHHGLG